MLRKLAVTTALAAALVGATAGAAFADPLVDATPCPDGYTGVIVEHNGRQTSVCQNIVP